MSESLQFRLARIQLIALVIGLVALGVSAFGAFANPKQFFFSYLFGFLFWLGLSRLLCRCDDAPVDRRTLGLSHAPFS